MFSNFFGAMADDNDNVWNISRAKIADAAFDYRAITKGKQRLKGAHAARASGGEENCADFIHAKKITTKARRHKELKPEVVKRLFLVT